jgi:hypothetical protein
MSEQTGGHIFLSHGSENRDEANAITRYLEERGLKVWIAPRDVRPGVDYSEALQEAIEACAAFVVLVTDKANKSPYVRVETEMAFSLHKPIFPVRTTDVKPGPGLALFLKIRHWTDAFGPQREESMDRLARELRAATGVSDPALAAEAASAPSGPAPEAAPVPAPSPAASSQWPAAASSAPPSPHREAGPSPSATGGAPADDEDLLRAYVGPNADHYLARWRSGTGGWSWTAFLFTAFWAAYRKMWPFAAGLAAAFLVLMGLGTVGPILNALCSVGILLIAIWFGLNGNRLYKRQADTALAGLGGEDRNSALGRARAAGGTSIGAMAGLIVLFLAVSAGLFFLMRPTTAVPVIPAEQPAVQGGGEQPAQPQPAEPGAQPQPQPADPSQPQPQQPQPQPGDEYYTPPPEEEPPTEGFYDPPQ